jgi:spore maturation protein A
MRGEGMEFVWLFLIATGCAVAVATGNVDAMVTSVLDGIDGAVALVIGLIGMFSLWVGIERLADEAGLIDSLAKALSPLFSLLFPGLKGRQKPLGTVTASVLSNALGLSSSTPLGLKAMSEIKQELGEGGKGFDSMIRLVIINAAGFCIFPSSVIALRAAFGSRAPALIAGPTAVAGLVATGAGLLSHAILSRNRKVG